MKKFDKDKISTDIYRIIKHDVCNRCNVKGMDACFFKHQHRCLEAYENQANKITEYVIKELLEKETKNEIRRK